MCLLVNIYLTGLAYLDNLLQVTTFFFQCRELVFDILNGKRNFYEVAIPEPLYSSRAPLQKLELLSDFNNRITEYKNICQNHSIA